MLTVIFIILAIVVIAAAFGGAFWFTSRIKRLASKETSAKGMQNAVLPFRWSYIALPLAMLLLSVVMGAYFYRLLPAEVAYHFQMDGTPDRWLSRGMSLFWLLGPQVFFIFMALGVVWGVMQLGPLLRQWGSTGIAERIIAIMGNMIALPQVIIFFAMLDIFSYNSYGIHIMPIWLFVLIVLGLASVVLLALLALIFTRVRR